MSLIEREAAKTKKVYCEERHEYVVPVAELDWLPAINAAPVVHGRWDYYGETTMTRPHFRCSVCNRPRYEHYACNDFRFCPNCGARMDGGEGHGL